MKKNMKAIVSSIENYKNSTLKAENDNKEAEKKIEQLISIIKSKDKLIHRLKFDAKSNGNYNHDKNSNKRPNIKASVSFVVETDLNEDSDNYDFLTKPNSVLNQQEIQQFKNILGKKDKYINKLRQKFYDYVNSVNNQKSPKGNNSKDKRPFSSERKYRKNNSVIETKKISLNAHSNKNDTNSEYYSNSNPNLLNSKNTSHRYKSRKRSQSLSEEKNRSLKKKDYLLNKNSFDETNLTKNLPHYH